MERIKERQKRSWQGMFYTVQRLDLLIISISGAGIYICLEALKFLKEQKLPEHNLIKVAGFVLLFAIIFNFVSQILGYWANYYDYLYCDEKLEEIPNESDLKKFETNSDCYNKWNKYFNLASAIIMFFGLAFLITYFMFIF